jgi:hypothetical protein
MRRAAAPSAVKTKGEHMRPSLPRLTKVEEITHGVCIWRDCGKKYLIGKPPPPDWRSIFLFQGNGKIHNWDFTIDVRRLDLDAVLCPEHTLALRQFFKIWETHT